MSCKIQIDMKVNSLDPHLQESDADSRFNVFF